MKLGPANQELFGKYPRFVGNPRQFLVFEESSMELFLETNWGENNMYSRIGYIGESQDTVVDKISMDFDGPGWECTDCGKLFQKEELDCPECDGDLDSLGGEDDAETIRMMRNDQDFAEKILGNVVEELRLVADYLYEERIPTIGIFTGHGFHVHTLWQPRVNPEMELKSTVLKWIDELDLEMVDKVPVGDTKRLMRMANCARITSDGEHCNLYTVPWTLDEMRDITIRDLLQTSFDTRTIDVPEWDREEMATYPEHAQKKGSAKTKMENPPEQMEVDVTSVADEDVKGLLDMLLQMPCIVEGVTQPDPRHPIRFNAAVMLFNRGFSTHDVHDLFSRLNWADWDSETTMGYLQQIHREQYREMSCSSLIERGFCEFEEDNRTSCPTYGWSGGEAWY